MSRCSLIHELDLWPEIASGSQFALIFVPQRANVPSPATNKHRGTMTMLFCLTADYTPQALNAMRENPNTNRREAVTQLLEAAGGKLIDMYGTSGNGPGAMVIFDVPDPAMAPAMCGVAVSSGSIHNVKLTRLFSMDEISGIRQKARQIRGAYKPPGQ